MLPRMRGVFTGYERAPITERTRRGRSFWVRRGRVNRGGTPTYGYRLLRETETGPQQFAEHDHPHPPRHNLQGQSLVQPAPSGGQDPPPLGGGSGRPGGRRSHRSRVAPDGGVDPRPGAGDRRSGHPAPGPGAAGAQPATGEAEQHPACVPVEHAPDLRPVDLQPVWPADDRHRGRSRSARVCLLGPLPAPHPRRVRRPRRHGGARRSPSLEPDRRAAVRAGPAAGVLRGGPRRSHRRWRRRARRRAHRAAAQTVGARGGALDRRLPGGGDHARGTAGAAAADRGYGRHLRARLDESRGRRSVREQELWLPRGLEAFCDGARDARVNPPFETERKVLRLVIDRVVVEEHRPVIRHVVPTAPTGLQPRSRQAGRLRRCEGRSDALGRAPEAQRAERRGGELASADAPTRTADGALRVAQARPALPLRPRPGQRPLPPSPRPPPGDEPSGPKPSGRGPRSPASWFGHSRHHARTASRASFHP